MKVAAKVVRSGGWWAIEVPEVPGVYSQAKRLDQVPDVVADAVATMLDIEPEGVEVSIKPRLREDVRRDVEEAKRLSRAAREDEVAASAQMRRAVADVIAEGLTVRDAATLLSISPQRVSQLTKS
jgi:predicted RNase H-like HicB family nuclease